MATSISMIGLGLMGRPMARVLLAAGFDVRGWNRSQRSEDEVQGIPLCSSLEEAAQAEVCLLMLFDSGAVQDVLGQLELYLSPGKIVLDMSSSHPFRSEENAKRLTEKGVGWVDAPVSGGPEGAKEGSLAIMAGGSVDDFDRVKPILEALDGNVVRVGEAGKGHVTKVINQLIAGLVIEAVAEGLILAEKLGMDPTKLQEAFKGGFADSKILQIHGTRMIERRYIPGGQVATQHKDMRTAQELAAHASIELPHLNSAKAMYDRLIEQGDIELDHSALHKLILSGELE